MFNRKYIDSFMVDFPASHVSFRGSISWHCAKSPFGPSDSSNEGLRVETKEGTVLVVFPFHASFSRLEEPDPEKLDNFLVTCFF